MDDAPRISISLAAAAVRRRELDGGAFVLSSPQALGDYERHVGVPLRRWAAQTPDRTFLAERDTAGGWRRASYAATAQAADAIAQGLIERGLGPERPVMILSGNSIDFAFLQLGAMQAGVPVAPVSPAYSLMSQDHAKLKYVFELVEPALVFADAGAPFARAIAALPTGDWELVVSKAPPEGRAATRLADLLGTTPTDAVEEAFAAVGPDSVAKILFTSGSTGMPKGVINTQRMLCANQQQIAQCWPFVKEKPPVLVDWLPWNHTFGGNHDFNCVLFNGGSLYIDGGRPVPGLIEHTVRNLTEVSPTIYLNVPAGFNALMPYLERDVALRASFFKDLEVVFYAAAALPQDLWERMEAASVAATGRKVVMLSAWGSTETAPMATSVHFPIESAGVIGLPAPGTEIKFAPVGGKLELRVKGPNVTPGYYKRPDLTEAAFDEDGFYRMGDGGKLADPNDPAKGIVFDGRTGEDFKLMTGTWVSTGGLRIAALAAASPALQDAVVTGHDRDFVGLLAWPNLAQCRAIAGLPEDADAAAVVGHDAVRGFVAKKFAAYNAANPGSSTRIARILLMTEPASMDANEITDKGYINQGATLAKRARLVARLYAPSPDADVIVP